MKHSLFIISWLLALSAHAQFVLNGDAEEIGDGCFRLTEDLLWQSGSVWYDTLISLNDDFKVDFSFFLGDSDAGADGIAFVLQPLSTGLGSDGGGIGYDGINPSLGIEFDTWQNADVSDPVFDHVAIMRDGILHHGLPSALSPYQYILDGVANVEDGMYHDAKIIWEADAQTISVYVDCEFRTSYTGDVIGEIFDGNPNVYMGFTSATGGSSNEQAVCFNYLTAVDGLDDVSICTGDTTFLSVPDGFSSYLWEPDYNISDVNSPTVQVWPDVPTTYTVTMEDDCGFPLTDDVLVTPEVTNVDLGSDTIVCVGYLLSPGPDLGTYTWSTGATTDTIEVTEPGTYWVAVGGPGVCPASDTIQVIDILDPPVLEFADYAGFCEGEGIVIDAGPGYTTYSWNTGSTFQSISVNSGGLFICTVTNEAGCENADSILVEEYPAPVVDFGFPSLYLCFGETELLNVFNPGATYLWQDGSTGSTYLADTSGVISVIVTSEQGCVTEESVVVISDCLDDLYFPNAFSPNGDGANDVFRPVLFAAIDDYQLEVWNRWGELVFASSQTELGWDGNFAGVEQELGSYLYSCRYRVGSQEYLVSGTVALMR